ncbi:MAG: polysaccharide deacetylase family protein [Clostridia bacterium]|nr:polysaccharide deacetylase family protein [Clostridia bacterium]
MKRLTALITALLLLALSCPASALDKGLPLQEAHKVHLYYIDSTKDNKSQVRLWQAESALPEVDAEINGIASAFALLYGEDLPAAKNTGDKNSRLDVEIRYSRTGLTWLSFLVQARTSYHRKLTGQAIASRTYDMTTGERVELEDIFPADGEAWSVLAEAVREQCTASWPDEAPDEAALASLCDPECLRQLDFTLHGMSLVIHIPAELLYPERFSLIEVTLMYPDIRPLMTGKAQQETDNLSYYKTCALTFDDGPSRGNTTKVLTSLMKAGSRATFFVIGNRIADYTDQVQREHDQGHAVAPHNWHHGTVTKSSPSALRAMKGKVDKAMIKAIGLPSTYDRVPGGLYPRMIEVKAGWAYIQWSVDTYDWRGLSAKKVLSRVQKLVADGDIILCHDIKDNAPIYAETISNWLAENGYMMLTIDELFAKDGVTLEKGHVYFRCADGVVTKK